MVKIHIIRIKAEILTIAAGGQTRVGTLEALSYERDLMRRHRQL